MKLTIWPLLKKTIDLLFFSERKLYGFPQSELLRFVFVYKVDAVFIISCLDTPYQVYTRNSNILG